MASRLTKAIANWTMISVVSLRDGLFFVFWCLGAFSFVRSLTWIVVFLFFSFVDVAVASFLLPPPFVLVFPFFAPASLIRWFAFLIVVILSCCRQRCRRLFFASVAFHARVSFFAPALSIWFVLIVVILFCCLRHCRPLFVATRRRRVRKHTKPWMLGWIVIRFPEYFELLE